MSEQKHTDEELKILARDIYMGKVFTDRDFASKADATNLMTSVFMPLLFMGTEAFDKLRANPPSLIYEYYDQAGPRSINGYPFFVSCHMIWKEDFDRMMVFLKAFTEAEKAIIGQSPDPASQDNDSSEGERIENGQESS